MRPARTAAAPRAIASSPATVGMLSVSERSLAETAIAVVAAIVFMTVCGNRSAERPGIPRWRYSSTNLIVDTISPNSVPSSSAREVPPASAASASARRPAATVIWQTRERRRASVASSSWLRTPVAWPSTTPEPVMTTRRPLTRRA